MYFVPASVSLDLFLSIPRTEVNSLSLFIFIFPLSFFFLFSVDPHVHFVTLSFSFGKLAVDGFRNAFA